MTTGLEYRTKEEDQHKKEQKEGKHAKQSKHWLIQTSTSDRYTALLEEESEDKQQKAGPEKTPKPPSIYITDVTNILPLI
jgi:hypothetical protein